ncbi:hypothetical protein L226DRAFT_329759 [Lentinus tigrinus ALCF2SS1-7]|uniref:F-box domain-containing protein n=1 Tax=Lentinus tigrinus ALCF2SS1-6 TaxID=1328759 RepID=A0A5C2SGY0_9APHY|nr:hypothetical protein L227DRAFT_609722 [Lentinus tigrinus ALCF2SS1-6]RPD77697.1 hypothetical protein L226DRAFT_329759 [Lentinus tigrinus ALCF2SS1-7]
MGPWTERALNIAEIIRAICEHLSLHKASLATLARTSKIFQKPAVASLWYDLPNLVPLVKCLPPDAWEVNDNVLSLTRPLCPTDWTKFLEFSGLVRELGADRIPFDWNVGQYRLHNEVIKRLAGLRPTIILFPKVYAIDWRTLDLDIESLQYLLSMIGDQLTTVSLNGWLTGEHAEHVLVQCLPLIECRSSRLRSFEVDASVAEPASSIAFSSFVCNLVALRRIDADTIPINAQAAVALCQLPTLRSLSVWLSDGERWPRNGSRPVLADSVINVRVHTTTATYSLFSQAVSFPKLYGLHLKIVEDPGPIPELFNSVRRQCFPETLRVLDIDTKDWGRLSVASQSPTVVYSEDFQPLLDFTELLYFSFRAECGHLLDDALFVSMAKAWPKLKSLHVSCQPYCAYESRPTFQALVDLAVHAPQLTTLGLQFDAEDWKDEVPWNDDNWPVYDTPTDDYFGELARRPSMSNVVKLDVGRSPIVQPHTVAYMLARIFPKLEAVWPGPFGDLDETEDSAENRAMWCEVDNLLPLFSKIRRDERRLTWQRIRNGEKVEEGEEEEKV